MDLQPASVSFVLEVSTQRLKRLRIPRCSHHDEQSNRSRRPCKLPAGCLREVQECPRHCRSNPALRFLRGNFTGPAPQTPMPAMDPSAKTMQAGPPFRPVNAGVSPKSGIDQHPQIKSCLFEHFDLLTMIFFVVRDDY